MAIQTIDGVTADFQNGGWYEGRQYWNGQLGAPGVIINPNQTGTGQSVSTEVVAQTNPDNVSYIQSAQQTYQSSTPTSKEAVTPFLNNYQDSLYNAATAPEVRIPTMEELKAELAPTTALPETLNLTAKYEELRTTYNVSDLESQLSSLKEQIQAEQDALAEQRGIEKGKPVAMGVIAGRISEEEAQAQTRLDALVRQQSVIVDELNTKYNIINQYMTLAQTDYNAAVERYQTEFNNNLKMYEIILGQESEARSAYYEAQSAARANLQIYANLVTSGNVDYASLDDTQKLMISKLEVQAGLPIGLISSIQKDPDANILFTTSNEGVTQVGIRNADGTISVQSYGTRITGSTETERTTTQKKSDFSEMNQILELLGGDDKIVSGAQWNDARSQWAMQGYDVKEFDEAFSKYANTDWDTYTGL